MIYSYKCKNFYSIDGEVEINFQVNEKSPANDSYAVSNSGAKISLIEAIIGPNASGKTNILKVLPMLQWMIVDSFNVNPGGRLPINTFKANNQGKSIAELSVVFEIGKVVYGYEIHLDSTRIYFEQLNATSKTSERKTEKTILKRVYDVNKESYTVETNGFAPPSGFKSILRQNATAISTAFRLNHGLSVKIANYWQNINYNVYESGYNGDRVFGDAMNAANAMGVFHLNPDIREKAEEILARYDLGFSAFNIEEGANNELSFKVAHHFGDQTFDLPLDYESSGTKQLFILLTSILSALSNGSLAVIDEFDARLHPDIVNELVGMFSDISTNPHSAQLVMSTHSHRILSMLDKYQIIITEKNEFGSTEAWRLDELKGVRADDNYFTKYMSGAYGGVPNLH